MERKCQIFVLSEENSQRKRNVLDNFKRSRSGLPFTVHHNDNIRATINTQRGQQIAIPEDSIEDESQVFSKRWPIDILRSIDVLVPCASHKRRFN